MNKVLNSVFEFCPPPLPLPKSKCTLMFAETFDQFCIERLSGEPCSVPAVFVSVDIAEVIMTTKGVQAGARVADSYRCAATTVPRSVGNNRPRLVGLGVPSHATLKHQCMHTSNARGLPSCGHRFACSACVPVLCSQCRNQVCH